jgi:hypothetical protein
MLDVHGIKWRACKQDIPQKIFETQAQQSFLYVERLHRCFLLTVSGQFHVNIPWYVVSFATGKSIRYVARKKIGHMDQNVRAKNDIDIFLKDTYGITFAQYLYLVNFEFVLLLLAGTWYQAAGNFDACTSRQAIKR